MSATKKLVPAKRASNLEATAWGTAAILLTPALLLYAAFTAYPGLLTFYNAFHIILPNKADEFIGFNNFLALVGDRTFWISVRNTLLWALVAPMLDVGAGFLLALALYAKVPFARGFRIIWFTPVLFSYVVVAILWMWIYNYDWGAVNILLRAVGLESWTRAWLGNPYTALPALMFTYWWKWTGFNMVVCLAALHALPSEVLEASELDNCGWLAKTRYIIVPMLRSTLLNLLILSFIGKMKVFDLVWIMTRGGPLWSTETVSTYVYKRAFDWQTLDLGYPSAVATIWFIVIVAVSITMLRLMRQRERLEY